MFEDVGGALKRLSSEHLYSIALIFIGLGEKLDGMCKCKRMFEPHVNPLRATFLDKTACYLEIPEFSARM